MLNVVFDMDGVLLDTERLFLRSWLQLADEFHVTDTEAMYRDCIGVKEARMEEVILTRQGKDFPMDEYLRRSRAIVSEEAQKGMPVKEGAFALLDFLKERNAKIALASSTKSTVVKKELGEVGLLDYFDELICGDMVTKSKPAPDIFLEACRRLGSNPENTIGIEDSFNGVRALRAAGMITFMVPDLLEPDGEISALTDRVFHSLAEVRDYLESQPW